MRLSQRQHSGAQALVGVGIGHSHARCQRGEFASRLPQCDTWLQPCDAEHITVCTVAQHPFIHAVELRLHHVWYPQVKRLTRERAVKRGICDANHREFVLVDTNGLADD